MPSKLRKLQDRQAALVKALRETGDALADVAAEVPADAAGEEDTEAIKAKAGPLQAKYDALKEELAEGKISLAREQELQEFERSLIPSSSAPNASISSAVPISGAIPISGDLPSAEPKEQPRFKSFGEQLVAVIQASQPGRQPDPRLAPSAAISGMGESIASEGGFLVQTDFVTELMKRTYQNNLILNGGAGYAGCRRIPISANSNSVKINAVNESSRADGSRWGGVRAYWIEEAGDKSDTKPDFRQIELSLKKLVGLAYATDELLQDAAALEAVMMMAFGEEFAFKIQDALLNGTGAGMPLGILNAGCLVTQAKENNQVAATVVTENIHKMWSRMWPTGLPRSVWLINQGVYPALFGMTLDVGTGGMPTYLPPGGLSQSPFGTLMGRPVIPVEQCQALGTEGDIYFCDWAEYLFAEKGGMQAASSIHVRFVNDETTFRFVMRCDGQPGWQSELTPYKGGATRTTGPFISLAIRE